MQTVAIKALALVRMVTRALWLVMVIDVFAVGHFFVSWVWQPIVAGQLVFKYGACCTTVLFGQVLHILGRGCYATAWAGRCALSVAVGIVAAMLNAAFLVDYALPWTWCAIAVPTCEVLQECRHVALPHGAQPLTLAAGCSGPRRTRCAASRGSGT